MGDHFTSLSKRVVYGLSVSTFNHERVPMYYSDLLHINLYVLDEKCTAEPLVLENHVLMTCNTLNNKMTP